MFSCWLYGALSYVLLFSSHISLCYCASLNACSDDHLLCYVIIVVISIWPFQCMIKLLTCFTSCFLDRYLIVTLYLSFYYLLYLEGLMYFVQVFQVTSIYVFQVHHSFSSFWKGEILSTFSLYCLSFYSVFCVLYPCCFCKLLGFVFIICRGFMVCTMLLCSLYALF